MGRGLLSSFPVGLQPTTSGQTASQGAAYPMASCIRRLAMLLISVTAEPPPSTPSWPIRMPDSLNLHPPCSPLDRLLPL